MQRHNVPMLSLRTHASLDEITPEDWDALVGDDNPFVTHAFLSGLERTGCIRDALGWRVQHLTLHEGDALVGALPLYLKGNSHGEYVFDWSWAHAWERHGLDYYPKLLCAVPYSPVTGPRLLVGSGENASVLRAALIEILQNEARRLGLSSAHLNFATPDDAAAFEGSGWLPRFDWQFHWENSEQWRDFDEFLAALNHKKRKNIRSERSRAARAGATCEIKHGDELDAREWDALHGFYLSTFDDKG